MVVGEHTIPVKSASFWLQGRRGAEAQQHAGVQACVVFAAGLVVVATIAAPWLGVLCRIQRARTFVGS